MNSCDAGTGGKPAGDGATQHRALDEEGSPLNWRGAFRRASLSPGSALFSSSVFLRVTVRNVPSGYRQFLSWLSDVNSEIKHSMHLVSSAFLHLVPQRNLV